MEIMDILKKIWSNIFLIPEARFDELTKDNCYKESFVYLLACFAIAFPIIWVGSIFLMGDQYAGLNINQKIVNALISTIIYVIIAIPFTYIGIGLCHILLKILGGNADLKKSVQIFIYGQTPSTILGNIPFIGWILSLIALVNVVLGAKRVHKISLLRSIVAIVVIPLLIAMILGAAFAAYLISSNSFTGPVY